MDLFAHLHPAAQVACIVVGGVLVGLLAVLVFLLIIRLLAWML